MERYLIINPFGIGDALFTMPVIKSLKDRHPGCFIGYWCNERVGGLLTGNSRIDRIFAMSRGDIKRVYHSPLGRIAALFKLISEIKRERFDAALDFSLDSRYGLWSKLAGIKRRIGLDYKGRGRFLTKKIKLDGYSGKHVAEYNLDVLDLADPNRRGHLNVPYGIEVSEEDRIKARGMLKEFGVMPADLLIGIAPGGGASWGKDAIYKQWPAEKFAEVADRLIRDSGAKVVLLGSADEKPLAEIIRKRGQAPTAKAPDPFFDLTGRLSLKELAAVISELKLLICNDGGPLHMAVALGVKTVSIFGPVDEKVYGPYPPDEKHAVIKKDMPCRPCYKGFRFSGCSNNRRCLDEITVEEVFEKVKSLL